MQSLEQRLASLGIAVPELLLPNETVDLERWAVIACDQHTSNREYWSMLDTVVGDSPSTLRIVFPEIYLNDHDTEQRIDSIQETMNRYLAGSVFAPPLNSAVYIERDTGRAAPRQGLLLCFDLEQYDYSPGSSSLIRATEGTILDRLPPRMEVRRGAPLELPHIMVLIDDPEHSVIAPLSQTASGAGAEPLYRSRLMAGGGSVRGYQVEEAELAQVLSALEGLQDRERAVKRYGADTGLLFAMGDGNHSLATAKAIWEELKAAGADPSSHPARWALAELVNLHDPALVFEPIHRIVMGMNTTAFLQAVADHPAWEFEPQAAMLDHPPETAPDGTVVVLSAQQSGILRLRDPLRLAAATVQEFLDELEKAGTKGAEGVEVDYIHGAETVAEQVRSNGVAGLILPEFEKDSLFRTVVHDGALPRKSFSMGVAAEKRYYLECRKILH